MQQKRQHTEIVKIVAKSWNGQARVVFELCASASTIAVSHFIITVCWNLWHLLLPSWKLWSPAIMSTKARLEKPVAFFMVAIFPSLYWLKETCDSHFFSQFRQITPLHSESTVPAPGLFVTVRQFNHNVTSIQRIFYLHSGHRPMRSMQSQRGFSSEVWHRTTTSSWRASWHTWGETSTS